MRPALGEAATWARSPTGTLGRCRAVFSDAGRRRGWRATAEKLVRAVPDGYRAMNERESIKVLVEL
jgi:hypothetical protein